MSILEPVPAQPDSVGNVTITINPRGEINVDQAALANILDSGQQSARVTFVRVGEEGATIENQVDLDASELLAAVGGQVDAGHGPEDGGSGGGPGSMLQLDQDQMMKLESVLQSDEAKNILGDINEVSTGQFFISFSPFFFLFLAGIKCFQRDLIHFWLELICCGWI